MPVLSLQDAASKKNAIDLSHLIPKLKDEVACTDLRWNHPLASGMFQAREDSAETLFEFCEEYVEVSVYLFWQGRCIHIRKDVV